MADDEKDEGLDLLEQLGLHPKQLSAQRHLLNTYSGMAGSGTEHPNDSHPLIQATQPKPVEATPPPMKIPSPMATPGIPAMPPSQGPLVPPVAPTPREKDTSELNRLQTTGSGVSQIKNPFLKGLARAGDIAGSLISPLATSMVPGTELHHKALINASRNNIEGDVEQEKANADQEKEKAGLAKTKVETEKIQQPEPDKPVHTYTNKGGRETEIFEKPDSSTYEKEFGEVLPKEPTTKEGELPLGDKIPQLNQALHSRYQVLNPGKPLPPEYTVPANATQKDYDRIDKALESEEKAKGTKAQQDEANSLREQARTASDEKLGEKMVIGEDKSGRQVAMSQQEAKSQGLKNVIALGGQQVEKIINARNMLSLFNSNEAENPGLLQMVKKMDKEGKLGVIASRWNDFLVGKVGAGDPEFAKLRVLMGLAKTALMNVHVGNRGGSYLFEHFEDLANENKMDGPTLLAALDEEYKYVHHRAMVPGSAHAAPIEGESGANDLQVGKQVTIRGKSMKITAVHPDGSFDAK